MLLDAVVKWQTARIVAVSLSHLLPSLDDFKLCMVQIQIYGEYIFLDKGTIHQ